MNMLINEPLLKTYTQTLASSYLLGEDLTTFGKNQWRWLEPFNEWEGDWFAMVLYYGMKRPL
jgi:hypothetical protein